MSGIYTAEYSQVEVYESTHDNIPLMRRCDDNWVNATQILKIAGYGKAQRTRLLEKEVHHFEHRKIQGGFGRFQGTWIPLNLARTLAENHKLTRDKVPVLYYDPAKDGPVPRKTKPTRKRQSSSNDNDRQKRAASAKPAPKKRGRKSKGELVQIERQRQLQEQHDQQTTFKDDDSKALPPTFGMFGSAAPPSQQKYSMSAVDLPRYQSQQQQQQQQQQPQFYQVPPPTFQDAKGSTAAAPTFGQYSMDQPNGYPSAYGNHMLLGDDSPDDGSVSSDGLIHGFKRHSNGDVQYHQAGTGAGAGPSQFQMNYFVPPAQQLPTPQSQPQLLQPMEIDSAMDNGAEDFDLYTERLLSFFSNDGEPIPEFLYTTPADFDVNKPIDYEGHTPLHWASALALPKVVELLVSKSANPLILNNNGMNSLSKLIHFANSFDAKNFNSILHLLRQCLIVPDARGRTPLHYIVDLTSDISKRDCLKYYLDEMLSYIKREQSDSKEQSKNLLGILLNHRDNNGDTALQIAMKTGAYDFAKTLISNGSEVHSSDNVPYDLPKDTDNSRPPAPVFQIPETTVTGPGAPAAQSFSTMTDSTKDQSLLLQHTSHSMQQNNSTFSEILDVSENKENIFDESLLGKETTQKGLTKSFKKDAVTSTPSKPADLQDGSALNSFNKNLPTMVSMLRDSISEELANKSEEISHNKNMIKKVDFEINLLEKKSADLLKGLFKGDDDVELNTLLNSTPGSNDSEHIQGVLKDRVQTLHQNVADKGSQLFNSYERSQALEVAQMVNDQEMQIEDREVKDDSPDDTLRLAVQLTLHQIARRKLIGAKVESIVASGSVPDDAQALVSGSALVDNDRKYRAKMYLYKKLISNICDLPIEDIDKELLDGIELRLKEGGGITA